MPWYKVCLTSEITLEKPKKFTVNGEDILIAKSVRNVLSEVENCARREERSVQNAVGGTQATQQQSANSTHAQYNQYYAFTNTCTHADKPLEKGKWNPESAEITCPFHKAVFAIAEQGAVKAPPAFVSLPVYKILIKQEHEGEFIYVEME